MDESFLTDYETAIYTDDRESTCFFTGHRSIEGRILPSLARLLKANIAYLYSDVGVRTFCAGGALGFDTLAAYTVYDLRRSIPDLRLVLELPFHGQETLWTAQQQRTYRLMLSFADEVRYTVDTLPDDKRETARRYLLARDRRLIADGAYCITYFGGKRGGTAYTVAHAESAGCTIINLFNELKH